MNPFVELAKKAVETFIKTGKKIEPIAPVPTEMKKRAGVFVSIYKKGNALTKPSNLSPATQKPSSEQLSDGIWHPQTPILRGCIGTYLPTKKNIAEEIIFNAIAAATQDPRFPPVSEEELPHLSYSVDVLSTLQKVKNIGELDPQKYGIILVQGSKKGLLLPNLPGVKSVEQQLKITALKAGIRNLNSVRIYKFTVRRYKN